MSDSSQIEISYQIEETYGEPDSGSNFQVLRHTGGNFGATTETTRSEEVRSDGQRAGTFRNNVSASPSLDIEFSPETFDDMIRGIMRNEWEDGISEEGTDVTAADNGDGTGTFSSTTDIDFEGAGFEAGQWVYVSGFSTDDANGWYKITDVSADDLTVAPAPADDSNGDSDSITIEHDGYVRNGTSEASFSLQRQFKDLTDRWELIPGCRLSSMSMSIEAGSIITGSLTFEGLRKDTADSNAGAGIDDPTTTEVLNAVDGVYAVLTDEDGDMAEAPFDVWSLSMELNQNARRRSAVGTLGSKEIKMGSLDLTGSMTAYLTADSWALLERYLEFDKFGLALALDDGEHGYVIEMPRIVLTNEPGNVPGSDEDVMLEFDFSAEPGESYSKTVQITRR